MLALPDHGMRRSIDSHNIKFDILCDWIEGSILFDESDDELSMMQVVDVLIEENIYVDQDFAEEIVTHAWNALEHWHNWIGSEMPFSFIYPDVKRTDSWQDTPARSFCILLSLTQCYRDEEHCISKSDYNEQGELFELLTQESLEKQFSDWHIKPTSWSRTQQTQLQEVVDRIAAWLGEGPRGDVNEWLGPRAKDGGLDLLCYRPFSDARVGYPVYLIQCASGQNWIEKVDEPDIDLWQRLIGFVTPPQKAFAIPFALSDDIFKRRCREIKGLFLDRYRLLAAARYCKQWESSSLKDRIIRWAEPRIDQLPWN